MPAEVYIYGFSYILSMVGFCIAQFLSGFIFVPFFREQKVTSVFEVSVSHVINIKITNVSFHDNRTRGRKKLTICN